MATTKRFVAIQGLDNNNNSITNLGTSGASLTLSGANALTITTSGSTTGVTYTGYTNYTGSINPLMPLNANAGNIYKATGQGANAGPNQMNSSNSALGGRQINLNINLSKSLLATNLFKFKFGINW